MNKLEDYGLNDYFIKQSLLYPKLKIARIISQYKNQYKIITELGIGSAKVSGKFLYNNDDNSLFPAVGDYVMVSNFEEIDNSIINNVLKRRTVFERKISSSKNQIQVIAANVDIVFICMSLNKDYNLNRLERYLSIAFNSGALPIIVLTKSDLCEDLNSKIMEVEILSPFSDIIITSIFDLDIENKLYKYLKPGITASFIGSSGVGKSTLINLLLKKDILLTKEIGKDDKGRHTTTNREMLLLSNKSIVLDTPGMRELGVDSVDLSSSFADIENLANRCKFNNCTHTNEKGCAVLEAIESGLIDQRRLDNYFKLKRESNYSGLNYKEIETEKFEKMFKEVGGMKNVRRHIKKHNKRNIK